MKCLIKAEFSCDCCGQVEEGQVELGWDHPEGHAYMSGSNIRPIISGVGIPKGWREVFGFVDRAAGRALICDGCRAEKETYK